MAAMRAEELRDMGAALAKARQLWGQSRYEEGLKLFQPALHQYKNFVKNIRTTSERQPWLQMQIDLENEVSGVLDYTELLQELKYLSSNQAPPEDPGVHVFAKPKAHVVDNQAHDPDVWDPPSPTPESRRHSPQRPSAPSWANETSHPQRVRPTVRAGNNRSSGSTPKREEPRHRSRQSTKPPVPSRRPTHDSKDGGLGAARRDNERSRAPGGRSPLKTASGSGDEKAKYSDIARDEGWADLELIEAIERDIVDTGPKTTFDDIAGLEHTKALLQEAVMLPQIAPHLFKDGRLKPCSGVLMFGPPGTGKTLLAKAVANVCNSTFFNISASTLASKYRGESEKMVRMLFEMARFHAPSILFMDEIDAIAGARGGAQEHESSRRVKTELLVQMNGMASGDPGDPKNRVMMLAATNLPWELDEAMRRRLTKRVYIPLPEPSSRKHLFHLNLGKVEVAPDVDFDKLVAETEGYSGDDICGLCDTAKMMPVKRLYTPELMQELHRKKQEGVSEEELKSQEKTALEVTWADFQTALANVSKSVGQEQLQRFVKWEEEFGSR